MCRVCNLDMRIMAHSYEFVAGDISSTLGSQDAANIEVERLNSSRFQVEPTNEIT